MDNSLPTRLLFSTTAAATAETVTYPLDFFKTRLQLHRSPTPQSIYTTVSTVIQKEGVLGLYSGLSPAVLRHVPYTGVRVACFETLKKWNLGHPDRPIQLPSLLLFGFTSGALGQIAAVPADVVKIRMQADSRQQHKRYRGVVDAFTKIIRQEGVRGLWRGSLPAVQRAALVNLGELSTYSYAKSAVINSGIVSSSGGSNGNGSGSDSPLIHLLAAMCSGFVSSLISTPADVVKTRMMEQNPLNPLYRGSLHCFLSAYRNEGLRGLYKGFGMTWARLGPWQLTFWVSYEQLRRLSGMQGF